MGEAGEEAGDPVRGISEPCRWASGVRRRAHAGRHSAPLQWRPVRRARECRHSRAKVRTYVTIDARGWVCGDWRLNRTLEQAVALASSRDLYLAVSGLGATYGQDAPDLQRYLERVLAFSGVLQGRSRLTLDEFFALLESGFREATRRGGGRLRVWVEAVAGRTAEADAGSSVFESSLQRVSCRSP